MQGFLHAVSLSLISLGEALPKTKQMNNNSTDQKEHAFYQYLLNTISAADFKTLHKALGITKRMTTMRLMQPTKMTFSMIQKLAPFLKDDLMQLVNQYELGYDQLTAREYTKLIS